MNFLCFFTEKLNIMEVNLEDIVRRVDASLSAQGKSRAEVCKALKMSNSTFTEWAEGTVPSIEKFVKVATYLKISVSSLLFGEPTVDLPEDQQKLLEKYEHLDARGKRIAQMIVETLVREQEYEEKSGIGVLEIKESEPIYGQFYLNDKRFEGEDMIILPILGKTAAGAPIDARETIEFPRRLLKGNESDFFCLEIEGYSMTEAGIENGDHVVLKKTDVPQNNRIMLVQHEGKTTLKRLKIQNGITYLCWEDGTSHEPIAVDSDGFTVQGDLVHIVKTPH
jgi:SOS-response transcriptional repressor LexA